MALSRNYGNAKQVALMGGPWAGLTLTIRPNNRPKDDKSLPVRVGQYVGRYNLNNGEWESLK